MNLAIPSHRINRMRPIIMLGMLGVLCTNLFFVEAATSQIARDGSLGQTAGSLTGPNYTIDVQNSAQQIRGNNLFHSFSDFNVNTGQTATFTGPNTIANIINRVTGQNLSNIDGAINSKSAMPNANFFLLNPNGLVVGPNASFNVGGSIHLSTADYVRMTDGAQFFASLAKDSKLTSAPVTAFGFLGTNPVGNITVEGGIVENSEPLSLVGRDLNDGTPGVLVTGGLFNPSGRVNLASVSSPVSPIGGGELNVTDFIPMPAHAFATFGTVRLAGGGIVTSGNPGGSVFIRGGNLVLEGSPTNPTRAAVIQTRTNGPTNANGIGIDVDVSGEVRIISNAAGAELASSSGALAVVAGRTQILPILTGDAGDIRIAADSIHLTGTPGGRAATIASRTFSPVEGAGGAGTIDLRARTITIENNARIQGTTFGPGSSGAINLSTERLVLQDLLSANPAISSTFIATNTNGEANAGSINVQADEIFMRGDVGIDSGVNHFRPTDIGTFQGNPSAGTLAITTGSLELLDGAQISVGSSRGAGTGGLIEITADSIEIAGVKPDRFVSGIFSTSEAGLGVPPPSGPAGDILISSKSIELREQGEINASTFRGGPGGNILISTDLLSLDDGRIAAEGSTSSPNALSGTIRVTAGGISLVNGASLTAGSLINLQRFSLFNPDITPQGDAGNISLAADRVNLAGAETSISTRTEGTGNAGTVTMTAGTLGLTENSTISSTTSGTGKAGSILIDGTTVGISNGAAVNSSSTGEGNAGTVSITATKSILVEGKLNSGTLSTPTLLSSQSTGAGEAGSVALSAPEVTIRNGGFVATSNAPSSGRSGDIAITGDRINIQDGAFVTTDTSSPAQGGTIRITSSDVLTIGAGTAGTPSFITASTEGPGRAGQILLSADELLVSKGLIRATTSSSGDAGEVRVATQNATFSDNTAVTNQTDGPGKAGNIVVTAENNFILTGNSSIASPSNGSATGDAGTITVKATNATVSDGGFINSVTKGSGQGGNIAITATDGLSITGAAFVSGDSLGEAVGNAGDITLSGGRVTITDRGTVSSTSETFGQGGSIALTGGSLQLTGGSAISSKSNGTTRDAGGAGSVSLAVSGPVSIENSKVDSSANAGRGGTVTVTGDTVTLGSGATVSATTQGTNNAGSILVEGTKSVFLNGSEVTTSAAGASGGDITLKANEIIRLNGAQVNAQVQGPGARGGNILIDPQYVIIQGGSVINASASTGGGGTINIVASQAILKDASSTLSATGGNPTLNGTINIQAPFQQLAGAIAPLPQAFAVATNLYGQRCAAQKGGQFSSFVQGARDGIPPQPGDLLQSPFQVATEESSPSVGAQPALNLAAVRLGLPQSDFTHRVAIGQPAECGS